MPLGPETRFEADPARVAIILPGVAYTPAMPLLYWTGRVLGHHGWTVHQVWWYDREPPDPERRTAWVCEAAEEAIAAESQAEQVLLVGKSLGSLAVRLAAERDLPGIWLTPLLVQAPVRQALAAVTAPTLLVGGTADQTWVGDFAHGSGHPVYEVQGGDHGLEVADGPAASAQAHAGVVEAIDRFAGTLAASRQSS